MSDRRMSVRVVIVEDERLTRQTLAMFLRGEGYDVREAVGVEACRAALKAQPADVVLLDLGLPGEDALAYARELRAADAVAVLVITQDVRLDTRLSALEDGVDDFVNKPVNFRELAARVRNLARRAGAGLGGSYRLGPWIIDLARRSVDADDGAVANLTRGEFDLLAALMRAEGQVVTRERLSAALSGKGDSDVRSVDALVSRIRRKLARKGVGELVATAPGLGYRTTGS
jgi:two-component system torCAD operon response regulator TorR